MDQSPCREADSHLAGPPFMETGGLLPSSQKPATSSCPKPD
jgi:hypothetical protein